MTTSTQYDLVKIPGTLMFKLEFWSLFVIMFENLTEKYKVFIHYKYARKHRSNILFFFALEDAHKTHLRMKWAWKILSVQVISCNYSTISVCVQNVYDPSNQTCKKLSTCSSRLTIFCVLCKRSYFFTLFCIYVES